MLVNNNLVFRKATNQEDLVIAQHFYQLWLDNEVSPDSIRDDWLEVTLQFILQARQELSFQAFVAEIEGKIIASASCQLFAGLYPFPFKLEYRQYGYIWNVYVESAYRSQGIATKLTNENINYLKSLGCTRAILHASPHGKPVYEKLGFVASNEMRLELIDF
ncbi:acetyltransferase. putative [Stanieria sp. NIES-3757]|nr:acetyltransferase. putative [Stanieria sp. NIES-3757]